MDLWLAPHDFRVRSLKTLAYASGSSPFGNCTALATDSHLVALRFANHEREVLAEFQSAWPSLRLQPGGEVGAMIAQAFQNPETIPVMAIGTPFQLTVWEFLRTIPPTSTLTYGDVARSIGHPQASRAVGQAVGANGIAVAIPCHRIVSRHSLTGYRWGLERKKSLLAWELARRDPLNLPF